MIEKIEAYVDQWNMLEHNDKVIAGISGGADSVCLLLVLDKLRQKIGFELTAVHINHQLRGESADQDERFVEDLCEKVKIPCFIYKVDVYKMVKAEKISEEEAGRKLRYRVLNKAVKEQAATKIALAHHKNDNVETMLMNLARGSGLRGAGGMRPVNNDIIRPFLCVERGEIEQYLKKEKAFYCEDETNRLDKYTRNRIRNHIVPDLEKMVNIKAVSHMAKTMEQIWKVQEYLEDQTAKYYQICVKRKGQKYFLAEKDYEAVPEVIRPLIIQTVLAGLAGAKRDIAAVHLADTENLFKRHPGKVLHLPYNIQASREYKGLLFQKRTEKGEGIGTALLLENQEVWLCGKRIKTSVIKSGKTVLSDTQKPYTKYFDYDIIKKDVCIRTRQPGDYITIDDKGSRQKLKAYFINEKIPRDERDQILLVAEGSHILWIVGYRLNPGYQVSSYTRRILKIEIEEVTEDKDGRIN